MKKIGTIYPKNNIKLFGLKVKKMQLFALYVKWLNHSQTFYLAVSRNSYIALFLIYRFKILDKQLNSYLYLTCNQIVAYYRNMNSNIDTIFKALADSTRRLILDELSVRNEMTLYELTARLIMKYNLSISRQGIAKHLSILEDAGLVFSKRKGKYRVLVFNNEPLKDLLKGWIE